MGEIFSKLLLSNDILSEDELKYYKKLQAATGEKKHLGDILLDKEVIDSKLLEQLKEAEEKTRRQFKNAKKLKRDKKVLEVVQKLGIVCQSEIALCIRIKRESDVKGEKLFLSDLFIEKGFLTPYLVRKFYKRGIQKVPLSDGIKHHEDLIENIPQYLKDRFLGKIISKSKILSKTQLESCWHTLKKAWPRKSFSEILLDKNLLDEKKVKTLLKVLKNALPDKYPQFDAQVRDTQLAKLLVNINFLSPWRLNKCLLEQLKMVEKGKYKPLRQILIDKKYLTDYQFDSVLKQYGDLVTIESPDFLVPSQYIRILRKEDIEKAIHDAESDVHLIVEEEDLETFNFEESFLKNEASSDAEIEEPSSDAEILEEVLEEDYKSEEIKKTVDIADYDPADFIDDEFDDEFGDVFDEFESEDNLSPIENLDKRIAVNQNTIKEVVIEDDEDDDDELFLKTSNDNLEMDIDDYEIDLDDDEFSLEDLITDERDPSKTNINMDEILENITFKVEDKEIEKLISDDFEKKEK